MKSRTKRKLVWVISSFCFVVAFVGITLALVFAAIQQTISTSISVSYVSKEVAGVVSATYKVKNGTEIAMENGSGGTTLEFDGTESTTEGGNLSPKEERIELTSTNNSVVFKYSFTNTGSADYVARVSQENTLDNLTMEVSKDGVNYTEINDYYMTVFGRTLTAQNYYVRFTIANIARNVESNIAFTWDLESIDRDTVALANGEAYTSFDEAANAALSGTPSTFNATNASTAENNEYSILSIIKDVEINGTAPINNKLVVYAEKDVTITNANDESICYVNGNGQLILGLPYDKKVATYDCAGTFVEGVGHVVFNQAVVNSTVENSGTAISLSGTTSRIDFNGGKIQNFAVGINLGDDTLLSMNGGEISACEQSFTGTGSLLIDSNEEVKISDTSFSGMSLTIEKGTVTLENVVMSGFTSSALIINGGNITVKDSIIEDANKSAIMIDGATVTFDGCEIRDNSVTELMTIDGQSGLAGAGLFVMGGSNVTIKDTKIQNNKLEHTEAVGLVGSAIAVFEKSTVNIILGEKINTTVTGGEYNWEV